MDTIEKARQDGRLTWKEVFFDTRDFTVFKEDNLLFVPKVANEQHLMRCFRMANEIGVQNLESDNNISGFSVIMDVGESAGQQCMYPYIQLIFQRSNNDECI